MSYSCVTGTAYVGSAISFQVPWAHETSELRAVCFLLTDDDYEYAVVSSGSLTQTATGSDTTTNVGATYSYSCPYESDDSTLTWGLYIWRETTTTEDDVEYDGSTIPIEDIVAKFEEHSDKGEETTLEALRSLRVPETDSNAFFPPKSVRADHIAGFDSDGNPTIGENCAEIASVYTASSAAESYANAAAASASAAASSATAAATYASNASTSATAAATSASLADTYANEAKSYATSAKNYSTLAQGYMNSAQEYAEETEEYLDEAKELLVAAQESADNLVEAIETAQAGASSSVESSSDLPTSDDEDAPSVGDVAYVEDENALYVYNGTSWEKVVSLSSLVGNVKTTSDLPTTGNTEGDVYFVTGECSYYQWDGTQWVALLQASSTVIVYTPAATSLVAGVVKLSTALEISTSNGYGAIGYNADEQIVVPIAGTETYGYGVVAPGDSVSVNDNGELVLEMATDDEIGGVFLSSSATIIADENEKTDYDSDENYNEEDYNFCGGAIAADEDGKIYTRTAQLNRFGVVKLGSKFQATHEMPYVVGIAASGVESTYGQLMFNLEEDGCLVYQKVTGSGTEGSTTIYELSALTATSSMAGTVRIISSASSSLSTEIVSPTVYTYTYIDSLYASISTELESINTTLQAHQAAVDKIDSIEGMSLFYITDDDGEETNTFYFSNSAQSATINAKILFAVNPAFSSNITLTVDSSWVTTSSTADTVYSSGSLEVTLAANSTGANRTATIVITYFTQVATIYIIQSYSAVAASTVETTTSGGDVATSESE